MKSRAVVSAPELFPVHKNREKLRRFFAGALPGRQTGPTKPVLGPTKGWTRGAGSALALAALALAAQAGAQTSPQTPPQAGAPAGSSRPQHACFNVRMINGFNAPDESTVYIRVSVNEIWRLKLFAPCPNVNWDQRIALQNRSGSSFICDAMDAELLVHDPAMGLQRCPISELHKLTPAEAAALPKKSRP